ncbi:MAG: terpene cyclase/mutase family protein [Acidobacteriales bacterium]|nr:terpene cyclase/mutase family protein [Terriglobales bacterium]
MSISGNSMSRLDFLESAQNADGAWGYAPGRQSWLEPTCYALLALSARNGRAFASGWERMRAAQLPSGAWPAAPGMREGHWVTALAITLHAAAGVWDEAFRRGVGWLLATTGGERGILVRAAHFLRPSLVEFDSRYGGWPWQPGTSSWVEPTAHTLTALHRAAGHIQDSRLAPRIRMGERMLLDRRCRDGGWNYGNRRVLGVDLPSYPESTALALMALAGNPALDGPAAEVLALEQWQATRSRLARAWLSLCLRRLGAKTEALPALGAGEMDVMTTAIEALVSA